MNTQDKSHKHCNPQSSHTRGWGAVSAHQMQTAETAWMCVLSTVVAAFNREDTLTVTLSQRTCFPTAQVGSAFTRAGMHCRGGIGTP